MNYRILSTLTLLAFLLVSILPTLAQDTVECESEFRSVTDAAGTQMCVPEVPQRVITLTDGDTDSLVALGVDPVGVSNGRGSQTPPRYLLDSLSEESVSVGAFYQPNLEIVLELEPDLILFSYGDFAEPEMIEQLRAIAPVYFTAAGEDTWRDLFYGVGDAMNMSNEVDAFFEELDSRIATLGESIEPETQFIIARWAAEGPQVMAPYIFAPSILQQAGMVMPEEIPDLQGGHAHSAPLSLESLEILDVDWAFVGTLQAEGEAVEALEAVFENPLFQQLEVVENDHVVVIDGSVWTSSGGPVASHIVLDVLEEQVIGATIECEAGLRAVADAAGTEMCVPELPQRVITLTDGDTDSLVALGVDPVGVSNGRGSQTPPRYLLDSLSEESVSVGAFYQPNLEIVLELEPDLILFSYGDFAEPEMIEQLRSIAPVYFTAAGEDTWRDLFYGVGDAMNMSDEVDTFFEELDSRIASLGESIEPDTQFIIARWAAEGPQVMAPYIFAPSILQQAGMVMPEEIPDLQAGHAHSAPLSLETLEILDSDWAFVGTLQAEGEAVEALEAVFDNPLFQQLEVVQNDHVVVIDGSIWTSSGGPIAANLVLDVVEETVLGE